jgi:hypothetical protein
MSDHRGSKARFRRLQRRGFWAIASCLLTMGLVVSGALRASPIQAGPVSLLATKVDIAVVPSPVTVVAGDIFTLEVWVYPHGQQVDVVDADMTFDPDKLEVLSITGDPSALTEELYSAFDNGAGTLTHSRGILVGTPPSTDFRLCAIEFSAKAATEQTPLTFTGLTNVFYGGNPVETAATDPTVVIEPAAVGGVGYLFNPGQVLAPWMMGLTVIAGLILGAVAVFRKVHRAV